MKVEKATGWIQGLNGKGVVYELSSNGNYCLATIWTDGKFHFLSYSDLQQHIQEGKGSITNPRSQYLAESDVKVPGDGSLEVSNPGGWSRLYDNGSGNDTENQSNEDILAIPVSISFTGQITLRLGGLSKILNILQ